MYQYFAMEAQAGATRCCINVILPVQLSFDEWGCNKGNVGALPLPISALP